MGRHAFVPSVWLLAVAMLAVVSAQGPRKATGAAGYNLQGAQGEVARGSNRTDTLTLARGTLPQYGADISPLSVIVDTTLPNIAHLKITDAKRRRYEVPQQLFQRDVNLRQEFSNAPRGYSLSTTRQPFGFTIRRAGRNGAVLFDTTGLPLVFKDQYIELNMRVLPGSSLFGLGEQTRSTGLRIPREGGVNGNGAPYTLWTRDIASAVNNTNLYGAWPFLIQVAPDGTTSGLLLANSNGQDITVNGDVVTWRLLGGIIDLWFFDGPTPADLMNQFTAVVGRPTIPPFWSLGFHQCKYGYSNLYELEGVVANYSAANIPLEVQWMDIDYMDRYRAFTLDTVNFPPTRLLNFIDRLHSRGQKVIPIVDPAISVYNKDPATIDGLRSGVFLRDYKGDWYIAQVWPGVSYFPDYLNPATQGWNTRQYQRFHRFLPFDGIWIDMNEVSSFCSGELCVLPPGASLGNLTSLQNPYGMPNYMCGVVQCTSDPAQLPRWNRRLTSLVYPPYTLQNGNWMFDTPLPLNNHTIGTTTQHYNGLTDYNTHNIYGLSMAKVTYNTMRQVVPGRPFILSRSTFPGAGAYVAHWTGDNAATWDDLRWSIPGILNSGLMGMPMIGADICGFNGNTTEELCNRWIAAGAFYPFSRDHNNDGSGVPGINGTTIPQELYRWASVAEAGRNALNKRYELLQYMYAAFADARLNGCPVARPLWFSYPADAAAQAADQQWLLGDGVLVTPNLAENSSSVTGYVPKGLWYDLWNTNTTVDRTSGGANATFNTPMDGRTPLHLRGGVILPTQSPALVTEKVRTSPISLLVALPKASTSSGMGAQQEALTCNRPARCGRATNSEATACGQLFTDRNGSTIINDQQTLRSHLASMSAVVTYGRRGSSTGVVDVAWGANQYFPGSTSRSTARCPSTLETPTLSAVTVLGLAGRTAPTSVTITQGRRTTVVPARRVAFDASKGTLTISGINTRIACPQGLRVAWK